MAAESSSRAATGPATATTPEPGDAHERTGTIDAPILGTPDDFPERPQRRRGVLAYVVIGLLVVVMAGGWGYVLMAARGNPEVRADVITYDAGAHDSAAVTFTVHKPADREAICRLRAVDVYHTEVGIKEVTIPSGKSDLTLTEELMTSAQATSVVVQYCDLV
ncbi:DUF4307 domain-containing protein [Microtetraspora sp. NBRC 16547]|uniref:DUF4307 domain-containing protein n=1 Tax=Microtetraspora sp. NBRC 16547 TaxID=3030993 RepID=UPI0024A2257B|nr:DUF4307 domain-containing protein [Microtetraspora sp. NBRC 16547]GLW97628.1 hypothetical protein Misp02_17150 [Microtetraspora sp. NBRC 16547]